MDTLTRLRNALAARYDVQRELGRGGMATVYLARDMRHSRLVAVKVMHEELSAVVGSTRFLREIQNSARLQHPNIVPVYDSGEADGLLYCVTAYIAGASLRAHVEQGGRMSIGDAVRVVREVADALAYSHDRGIMHRDIKPDNILMADGHAVLADFGIARAIYQVDDDTRTATGLVIGTPAYMSPEQAAGSTVIDGRSDIYSLGCVLYELVAGRPPFQSHPHRSAAVAHLVDSPVPIEELRDDVPRFVARALTRALEKDPEQRFSNARQFAAALADGDQPRTGSTPRGRRLRSRVTVGLAAIVAVGVSGVALTATSSGIAFEKRGWVVIADFASPDDPALGRTLATATMTGLQQSTVVNVLPRHRIVQTLRRMRRPPDADTLIDERIAREIAQREGLRYVVAGDVARVGESFAITTRIVDAGTGEDVRTHGVHARNRDEVVAALDKVVRGLRRDFGESALAVWRDVRPLPQVTTASLDALRKYAEGRRLWAKGKRDAGFALLQEAIALDSTFALAHAAVGMHHYWGNNPPLGEQHFRRALAETDRLTDRERMTLRAEAAAWSGDRDEASVLYTALLAQYPDDRSAMFAHGYNYLRAGRLGEARDVFRRLTTADSLYANSFINLATAHSGLGEQEEALAAYHRAFALDPSLVTSENLNNEYGGLLAKMGRVAAAESVFTRMLALDTRSQARGYRSLGMLELYRGRYRAGLAHLREATLISQSLRLGVTELRNRLLLAAALDGTGRRSEADRELARARELFRTTYLEPAMLKFLGRSFARRGDTTMALEVLDSLRTRANPESESDRAAQLVVSAEIDVARGRTQAALEAASIAFRVDSNAYHLQSLANSQANAGQFTAAVASFRRLARASDVFGWEAQEEFRLVHYLLGRLHERLHDTASAVSSYQRFLEQWKDADQEIREITDAKARFARLAAVRRTPGQGENSGTMVTSPP